jgi:multicomponent Na+:H+ antiporter subunit D
MENQLPALQVVLPLMAAPLCVALRRRIPATLLTTAVCWSALVIAILLLERVLQVGVVSYYLGDWAAPWGIEYRVDALSAFVLVLVSGIGAVTISFAPRSLADEIPDDRHHLFLASYLLCLTGLLGIVITGDLFNVFVFLEISALASYAMISLGRERRALTAAFQYLIMGTIGATFILIGIGLMYIMTGTLNMVDMAQRLDAVKETRTVLAAFGFLTVGIGLKAAIFPLHVWLPNAYTYAPSVVSAFLAATSTKVSVYIMLRFVFTVYGVDFAFNRLPLDTVLLPLAVAGAFAASTVAIFQHNVKRMLAYSSVAQIGYMTLGLSLGTVTGLTASIVHLFNHALTKGALFMALGCVALRLGSVRLRDMRGLGRQMPWTMAAFVLGGLSLIGMPLTAGFISKWYLIGAALESGHWAVAALVLLTSLIAVVYVWRVVEVVYFHAPPDDRARVGEAPLSMLVSTWALVGAVVLFGSWSAFSSGVARRAASYLLGAAP